MAYRKRFLQNANKTSWKRRRCLFTPARATELDRALEFYDDLQFVTDCKLLLGEDCEEELAAERAALATIRDDVLFESSLFNKLKRNTLQKRCVTVDAALNAVGAHGAAAFVAQFGFTPDQVRVLARKIFNFPIDLKHQLRGMMGPEEATLLLCARRKLARLVDLVSIFGRDPAALSAFHKAGTKVFTRRFAHLVDMRHMGRFSHLLPAWNAAFHNASREKSGSPLVGRFQNCNVVMDGFRVYVCASSEDADLLCNPYCGNVPNLLFLIIVGGDGMVLGMSFAQAGYDTDSGLANKCGVEQHLTNAGMVALTDKLFGFTERVKPIPRDNQEHPYTDEQLAGVSSARVVVEWANGEFLLQSPIFHDKWRHQVLNTCPTAQILVSTVLTNVHKCFNGCIAQSKFGTDRVDFESYFVPKD